MIYSIERSKDARKYFKKGGTSLVEGFFKREQQLLKNPLPTNAALDIKAMEGVENIYRLRIGDYRLVYEVYEAELVILMLDIDSRGDIYKRR